MRYLSRIGLGTHEGTSVHDGEPGQCLADDRHFDMVAQVRSHAEPRKLFCGADAAKLEELRCIERAGCDDDVLSSIDDTLFLNCSVDAVGVYAVKGLAFEVLDTPCSRLI